MALSGNGQAISPSLQERRVQLSPAPQVPRSTSGKSSAVQAEAAGSTPARGVLVKTERSGAAPRMRRKHEVVGSNLTALMFVVLRGRGSAAERALDKRETLVRLHPSLLMAADDQWQVSGLWPREAESLKRVRFSPVALTPRCPSGDGLRLSTG